jgi:hypothetical protein
VGAAERLLGVRVEPSLCFLDPELILHAYQRSELLAGQQVNQEQQIVIEEDDEDFRF